MKSSMDFFGDALMDRFNGNIFPFYLEINGEKVKHDLSRYFKFASKLKKVDRDLISMCLGEVLDIGCGTGNYMDVFSKKMNVVGIDISPKVIDVAHKMGNVNCFVADIFTHKFDRKFDTITLFENNFGIAGTLNKAKKLLKIMYELLRDEGQVLMVLVGGGTGECSHMELEIHPVYKEKRGAIFKWINVDPEYLSQLCMTAGFDFHKVSGNQHYNLVHLIKK